MPKKLTRLYSDAHLSQGQKLSLDLKESHYLRNVLRLIVGEGILIFNNREGEWYAEIIHFTKKEIKIEVREWVRAQKAHDPVSLLFSPLKPGPMAFLMEKATELGVTDFYPLWMSRTQGRDFKYERYLSILREATEQSERMNLPTLHKPLFLEETLTQWDQEKKIAVCAERSIGQNLFELLQREKMMNSVMIGPEGGFTPEELSLLNQLPYVTFVSLGPNILRAETAALSALSLLHTQNVEIQDRSC